MKKNLKKYFCSLCLALATVLMFSATASAADKSIAGGVVNISGVLSESTVQYVIPAESYFGTPEKEITVPLYKLDQSSKVVYDVSAIPESICWLNTSCKLEGDRMVNDEYISVDYVREGEFQMVSNMGQEFTVEKVRTYSFSEAGYYLLQYDPTPKQFRDGDGGGIVLSEKAEYIILQVDGASVPAAPATPAIPVLSATMNQSPVLIDGVETPFQAYTINDNNYFKLRDIASVLSGCRHQFEVTWDAEHGAIQMIKGQPYTAVGGEMILSEESEAKVPVLNQAPVYLDGKPVELMAYTIDGNNYFKLRDLGAALEFNVSWDSVSSSIVIDLLEAYTNDSDSVSK